jgi:hypothetical protein
MVKSASFSMPAAKGLIKRIAAGKKPIAQIFTSDQEAFLKAIAGKEIDFTTLAVLGPLMASRWKFTDAACPWPITAELWTRADGKRLMEVSIKAPAVQAAVAVGGFMAYLAEFGAERDRNQQTKTRWALDFYVARLARPPARKVSSGKAPARKAPRKPARKTSVAKRRRPAPR